LRDVSGDTSTQHIPQDIGTEQRTNDLEVVFIQDTAACKLNVMVAMERYGQSPLKIPRQLLTIYSYEGRKSEYIERKDKQRCA